MKTLREVVDEWEVRWPTRGYDPRFDGSEADYLVKVRAMEAGERDELYASHKQLLVQQGVPRRRLDAAEVADLTAPAMVAVSEWIPARNMLALGGPVGVGKTVAAVRWLFEHGGRDWRHPLFVAAAALEVAGRYDEKMRSRWREADGLVIDDLGCEFHDSKGNFASLFDEIVDFFSGNGRALCITTNLRAAEFAERYGARVASRWAEHGTWKNIVGPDRRRAAP